MRLLVFMTLAICAASTAFAADELNPLEIKEWSVPWSGGRPRDPFVAPDGSVWFVGQKQHYIARFDPRTAKFSRRKLTDGAGPHNLIVGSDGVIWYAGNRVGYIGRYDPKTKQLEKIKMPRSRAADPHTLVFDRDEKHIWFTVQWGNFVGRLRLSDRKVSLIPVPTADARPYGITIAPNGRPWIALVGTNKLASIDPATLKLSEHPLPNSDAAPRRLVTTSDGQVYFVNYSRGFLGHLNPANGALREWPAPSQARSGPYAMAVDHQDRIWFVETGVEPNLLVGFSSKSKTYISITKIPSGAGSVRHMVFHRPSGAIWFGTDAGTLGRAILPRN